MTTARSCCPTCCATRAAPPRERRSRCRPATGLCARRPLHRAADCARPPRQARARRRRPRQSAHRPAHDPRLRVDPLMGTLQLTAKDLKDAAPGAALDELARRGVLVRWRRPWLIARRTCARRRTASLRHHAAPPRPRPPTAVMPKSACLKNAVQPPLPPPPPKRISDAPRSVQASPGACSAAALAQRHHRQEEEAQGPDVQPLPAQDPRPALPGRREADEQPRWRRSTASPTCRSA